MRVVKRQRGRAKHQAGKHGGAHSGGIPAKTPQERKRAQAKRRAHAQAKRRARSEPRRTGPDLAGHGRNGPVTVREATPDDLAKFA